MLHLRSDAKIRVNMAKMSIIPYGKPRRSASLPGRTAMNARSAQLPGSADRMAPGSMRDEFIDLCRAFSLLVVVLWHWVFTIVVWHSTGPSADSPLSFTRNLWILTWLLQVMPVFFFVGGYAHLQLWSKLRGSGGSFVLGRMRRLLVPSLALLAVWGAVAAVAEGIFHVYWFGRAALLIISPLWFIAVYLALVLLAPLAIRLHQRFGPLVVVVLAGLAALVDVLRFGQHVAWAALINLLVVWALCHQLGSSTAPWPTATGSWRGALCGAACSPWSAWCSPTSTRRRWWACPATGSPTWDHRRCASSRCASSRPAWCCWYGRGCWSACAVPAGPRSTTSSTASRCRCFCSTPPAMRSPSPCCG